VPRRVNSPPLVVRVDAAHPVRKIDAPSEKGRRRLYLFESYEVEDCQPRLRGRPSVTK